MVSKTDSMSSSNRADTKYVILPYEPVENLQDFLRSSRVATVSESIVMMSSVQIG